MADIFISYASEDQDRIEPLAIALEDQGWSVFWDREIPPGKTWNDIIEEAIEAAKCIIVVWTKESVNSGRVRAQAQEGLDREILVPVMFEDAKIPLRFRPVQAANLIGWEDNTSDTGFKQLQQALIDILGTPPVELEERKRKDAEAEIKPDKSEPVKIKAPGFEPVATAGTEPSISEPISPKPRKASNALRFSVLAGVAVLLIIGIWWYITESQKKKVKLEVKRKIERILEDIALLEQNVAKIERPEQLDDLSGQKDSLNQQAGTLSEQAAKVGLGPQLKEIYNRLERVKIQLANKVTKNSIGMEFVFISAGSYTMGSNAGIGRANERPSHTVKISRPFYLQKTEVTQGQWKEVMGDYPSGFKECDDCPVEIVSWEDAQKLIKKLNELEGGDNYRLPTEAEWEYAARAGTTTLFSFGDDLDKLTEYAWFLSNSDSHTHVVGTKKPNPWGLYDMYGNVWEWVEDDWHEDYDGAPDDGRAWINEPRGADRVVRGGGWFDPARGCRSAIRRGSEPDYRNVFLGFRLARSVVLGP